MPPDSATINQEQQALLTFLLALRLDRVRDFLGRHELARYGNRADLRERLGAATMRGERAIWNKPQMTAGELARRGGWRLETRSPQHLPAKNVC